jgi:hypothetical protein
MDVMFLQVNHTRKHIGTTNRIAANECVGVSAPVMATGPTLMRSCLPLLLVFLLVIVAFLFVLALFVLALFLNAGSATSA